MGARLTKTQNHPAKTRERSGMGGWVGGLVYLQVDIQQKD